MNKPWASNISLALALCSLLWVATDLSHFDSSQLGPAGKGQGWMIDSQFWVPAEPDVNVWQPPISQSAGSEWIFEVFTPPLIYFNRIEESFVITPPFDRELPDEQKISIGLTRFVRPPYRLQFAGYIGESSRYRIQLHDLEKNQFYRGQVGEVIEESEFQILDFQVNRILKVPSDGEDTPFVEEIVQLSILDLRDNRMVALEKGTTLEAKYGALIVLPGEASQLIYEGDVIAFGGSIWTCRKVNAGEGFIMVEQVPSESTSEPALLTLYPREATER